ncbi:hypothetical protein DL95DRAFT_472293 [Leptodontidium sp. 2 PMI_412]|nr:hypothetical protein DL95DRAFT_472293 [Leptodontidium sp. 2 PMI_412]
MENTASDWLNSDHSLNYGNPEILTSDNPRASPAVERADQPSGGHTLPLLRLSSWESEKQYDKRNPVCIHYDFQWKTSQREKIRARRVYSDTDPDLDEDKFPEDKYTCEETIIELSVERSRRRGLTKRCKKLEIDWQQVDEHLEGLSDLFSMGRKITLSIEFVYKEVACDSTTAKGKTKKNKKSATEAQRL